MTEALTEAGDGGRFSNIRISRPFCRLGEPANHNLRDRYFFEGFYRFQLTSQVAVTPDLQWILHPTLNPNTGSLWVASLRARVTF